MRTRESAPTKCPYLGPLSPTCFFPAVYTEGHRHVRGGCWRVMEKLCTQQVVSDAVDRASLQLGFPQ